MRRYGEQVIDDLLSTPPALDRAAGTPAHVQIEHWLVDVIAKGGLAAGDRLPAERAFAQALGVSRMTLRQALAGLEQRGVLMRTTGRTGGAFVVEPKIDCDLTGLAGFTEQMRRAQKRAGARVVVARTAPASRATAEALGVGVGDPVHELVRVRSANRIPLALERSYLPAERLPGLLDHRLTGSVYALLERHYDLAPSTAVEFLEPVIARVDEAEALGIAVGSPLMLIERTAYSAAGVPVEFARDLFRADRMRIMVRSGVPAAVRRA